MQILVEGDVEAVASTWCVQKTCGVPVTTSDRRCGSSTRRAQLPSRSGKTANSKNFSGRALKAAVAAPNRVEAT
jgi:hypothetical protein